jgi:hypothetical protein
MANEIDPQTARALDRAIACASRGDIPDSVYDRVHAAYAEQKPSDVGAFVRDYFGTQEQAAQPQTLATMPPQQRQAFIEQHGIKAYATRLRNEMRGKPIDLGAGASAVQPTQPPSSALPEHDNVVAMSHEERQAWISKHGLGAYRTALTRQLKGKTIDLSGRSRR